MARTTTAQSRETNRLLLDQLADKWTILILGAFCNATEPVRFNEIKRRVNGVSQKTLTLCLRRLERNGIVARRIRSTPLSVEYAITRLGRSLSVPFDALQAWTDNHLGEVLKAQIAFDEHAQRSDRSVVD